MIPNDKLIHFLGGFALAAVFNIWVAIIVGVGKEIYDYYHQTFHTPEWMDFIATAAGGLLALLLL